MFFNADQIIAVTEAAVNAYVAGWGEGGSELAKERFLKILAIIEKERVPLAALWVYDFDSFEQTWNVTGTNYRAYQLKATAEAHKRMQGK